MATEVVKLTTREFEIIEGMELKARQMGITVYEMLDHEIRQLPLQIAINKLKEAN